MIGGAPVAATGTIISEEGFTTFFSDDFATNTKGWALGTEWQIGSATVSTGQTYGNPDPGVDYTPTTDNGVAGVVIGGNASTALHDFYYFTSPIINTSTANNLFFEYARWLNSDYTPYMQNTVDVFNGSSWINLWSSGESPGVQDNAWTPQKFDISTYKSASTQIRFGFNVGSDSAFTVSSWNIDDVKLYGDGGSTLPVITVAATDASAAETIPGATTNPGQYTLTRTGVTTSALTVNVLMSGTATNGTDYTSIPTTATFAIGSTTALVNLNVIDDILVEQTIETAILTVGTGTGYTVGTTPSAAVNITDNDVALPVITVAATDASAAETIPGATTNPGQYTLTRTGPITSALTVNVTKTGTATNGVDYTSIPTTVTFNAGSATALVPLNVIYDTLVEATETAILNVTAGNGYTVGTSASATVSIADGPLPVLPSITLASNYSGVSENGKTNLVYTFNRTGATTSPLTVNFGVSGTAINGDDYVAYGGAFPTPTQGTITFAVGATTAQLALVTSGDTVKEINETIGLTLTSGTGYQIGTPTVVTTTILNDDGVLNQQGTTGNDVIEAGSTSTLSGKAGNDILIGSSASNILVGGAGNDTLTTGTGFDTVLFTTKTEGIDTITDFNVYQDLIQVSAVNFGGGLIAGESISSDQFSISLGSVTANTRFIFDKPTGKLFFDIDGSGSNSSVQFASLTANLGLTADNIFAA
jgi:Ca2+-binding RTX toxin-like protein